MATEERVMVACAVCTIQFDVSARTARNIAAGRSEARCVQHRVRRPRPATVQAAHRRFWLDRFTLDEIKRMAWDIYDDIPTGPAGARSSGALLALAVQGHVERRISERELDPDLTERAREARRRVAGR